MIYGVNYNKTPPFPIDLGLDKAADEKKRPNLKLEEHLIVPDPGENPFPSEEEPGTAYDPD